MKSSLFLMEQLIAILVFAICAAVCVRVFAASFAMSNEGRDMNNALIIAKNGAECYKSVSGDGENMAHVLSGVYTDNEVRVYYDEKRQPCGEDSAAYILSITGQNKEEAGTLHFGELSVEKSNGEEIIAFEVAARRNLK